MALAESLGGVETLISHPASMTHASVPAEQRQRIGVTDDLVRVSVGIEDIEDLRDELADIEGENKDRVLEMLGTATTMLAFQLSEEGHDNYRLIDPFWDWLFERYPGLLQIDEEGYYSQNEQILALD